MLVSHVLTLIYHFLSSPIQILHDYEDIEKKTEIYTNLHVAISKIRDPPPFTRQNCADGSTPPPLPKNPGSSPDYLTLDCGRNSHILFFILVSDLTSPNQVGPTYHLLFQAMTVYMPRRELFSATSVFSGGCKLKWEISH